MIIWRHFILYLPPPPENGGFLNRVAQILLQKSRNWTLQTFFKSCRQIINPSNFISQRAPMKSWAFRFQPSLLGGRTGRCTQFTFWASDFTCGFTLLLMTFVVNKPLQFGHLFSATYCTCTNYKLLFQVRVTSRQVKRTPQDSINELNIWKMNLLILPVTIVKFKSAFLHAQWAVNVFRELPCIWSNWKSLNGLNLLEDMYIKFRETELVEIS